MVSKNKYGTAYDLINSILGKYDIYQGYRSGNIRPAAYLSWLLENKNSIIMNKGLNEDQLHLSTRIPIDEERFVDEVLSSLVLSGIISDSTYNKTAFEEFRSQVYAEYNHQNNTTYIFPEEERLCYALADIIRPKSAIILGSYYGYWSVWTLPSIKSANGQLYMVDNDKAVCNLAEENILHLGFSDSVKVICQEAASYLEENTQTKYDLILLDAEGPETHPNEDFVKKGTSKNLIITPKNLTQFF